MNTFNSKPIKWYYPAFLFFI